MGTLIGKVKWFNEVSQFGFITHNGQDYFVHQKALEDGLKTLVPEQTVEFEPHKVPKGLQARAVRPAEVNGNV